MTSAFLNLDDLYGSHIKRDRNKLRFYDEIHKRCLAKIKKTNQDRSRRSFSERKAGDEGLNCYYKVHCICLWRTSL